MAQRTTAAPRVNGFLARRPGWWRLMIVGVIILIATLYVTPVRAFVEKSRLIQSEKTKTESLRSQRDKLQFEKDSLQNNSYVEQVARRDLGMVKPGEQPYVVKDLNTEESPAAIEAQPVEELSVTDRIMETLGSLIP
ncbi:MAG: septum formation initiator family protein [Thermoleophilia bacterium]|nr:septum formation initiator family protein [Thermoleophilia bacterium]